jgi:hypothetical protein
LPATTGKRCRPSIFYPYTEADDFEAKVGDLLEALDTDSKYVSQHTTLEQRAVEWHENGRRAGFLLREDALLEAEDWLASSSGKTPPPTDLQIAYIQASRRTTTRQQRTTIGALTFGSVVALMLAALSFVLFQQSESNLSLARVRGTGEAQVADTANSLLGMSNQRLTAVAQQAATATNAQGEALFQAGTATSLLGLSNQRGTEVAEQAATATNLLGLSNQRGTGVAQQAATATNAQGEALFQAGTATSLLSLSNQRGTEVAQQAQTAVAAQATSERRADESRSLALASGAVQQIDAGRQDIGVALAVEANLIEPPSVQARRALLAASYSQILSRFEGHTDDVWSVAFSPDGQTVLSGSVDKTLILWDVATGEVLRTFEGHTDDVWSVAFSPDGQTALSASKDNTLILWEVATGEPLRTFEGHTDAVVSVAFSPDGQMALSGSCYAESSDTGCVRGELILWEVATGEPLRTFEGHTFSVRSVAFSPDGQTALSGSYDRTLILWDLATGEVLRTFEGHRGYVVSVAFSPDGQTALSGSYDTTLILWRVLASPGSLLPWVENNRYVPELACEQRALYGVDVQCDENGVFPTRTPFPTLTPSPTPMPRSS